MVVLSGWDMLVKWERLQQSIRFCVKEQRSNCTQKWIFQGENTLKKEKYLGTYL